MPIRVRFFAALRELAGKREIELDKKIEGETISGLVKILSKKFDENFNKTLIDPETGNIRHYIKIMVNGKDMESLKGLNTMVKDGDIVQFFPPIGGG